MIDEMIEFLGDGDRVPGYLARPENVESAPAVVVLQEWWGLNAHIKDVARRFAAEGFVALAPDLYRGQVAAEPDEARKLAMALDRPQAVKDIQGAVNHLTVQPYVNKIGVVGFCMGGGLAGWMATDGHGVDAVVIYYGRFDLTEANVAQVSVPVLGLFGEADAGIPVEQVQANEHLMKQHGKVCEFVIYPDAPHAFFNDERPSAYHKEAAEDAWARTLGWFRKYLA